MQNLPTFINKGVGANQFFKITHWFFFQRLTITSHISTVPCLRAHMNFKWGPLYFPQDYHCLRLRLPLPMYDMYWHYDWIQDRAQWNRYSCFLVRPASTLHEQNRHDHNSFIQKHFVNVEYKKVIIIRLW